MQHMLFSVEETKVKICLITLGCINYCPDTGNSSLSFFATLHMQKIGELVAHCLTFTFC